MTLNDGVAWGTIIGGIAGFLSFAWVIFDKTASRPKLITSVRKATFRNEGGGPFGGEERVCFKISLEVGNIGTEPTTITRVHLILPDSKVLDAKDHQHLSGGITFIVDDNNTRICEKGIAFVEHLMFYADKMTSKENELVGLLRLTLIGGKVHEQKAIFKNEEQK